MKTISKMTDNHHERWKGSFDGRSNPSLSVEILAVGSPTSARSALKLCLWAITGHVESSHFRTLNCSPSCGCKIAQINHSFFPQQPRPHLCSFTTIAVSRQCFGDVLNSSINKAWPKFLKKYQRSESFLTDDGVKQVALGGNSHTGGFLEWRPF